MARLASEEKMGYYPTPTYVVQKIKQLLQIEKRARLIDTCCGEGEALSLLAQGTGAETYGVELDKERYLKAKQRLNHVLWCDSLNELICTREAFSLLWLNPPYDTEEGGELDEKERLELVFLKKHFPLLQRRGILILIIPYNQLARSLSFLRTKCTEISVYRFPDDLFWQFKQIVLIAVKDRPDRAELEKNDSLIQLASFTWSGRAYETLDSIEDAEVRYHVPESEKEKITFKSTRLDPEEAVKLVKKSPLWKQLKQSLLSSRRMTNIRPLMPLREGHLAMLLASGMMNGEVKGKGRERLIIKGTVKKEQDQREERTADGVKIITTDRYEITVRAIRFSPEPEIITIR